MASNVQKPVLITGITGFIGSHIAERLLREGAQVRGMARQPEAADWLTKQGAEIVAGDLLDGASVVRAMSGCTKVVHAAGWTGGENASVDLRWRANVEGTSNVILAVKETGVERLLYISSIAVYGLNRERLIDETMATPLVGEEYPDSKITAESLIRTSGLPYVIIRPASTYGPRGKGWTVGIINQIQEGLSLQGKDEGLVTPGYIENVIDGLFLALTRKSAIGHTFNICDDRAVTYRAFFLTYARMLGLAELPTRPEWRVNLVRSKLGRLLRRLAGRQPVGKWSLHFRFNPSQYSIEHARHLLGYTPKIDFSEGMRLTEAWLRTNCYLP